MNEVIKIDQYIFTPDENSLASTKFILQRNYDTKLRYGKLMSTFQDTYLPAKI